MPPFPSMNSDIQFQTAAIKYYFIYDLTCANLKSNLSLYSLCYAEACNELAGLISVSLRPVNKARFEEMLQRWRAIGKTVSDLTGSRFELQTACFRRTRYRSTNWLVNCESE